MTAIYFLILLAFVFSFTYPFWLLKLVEFLLQPESLEESPEQANVQVLSHASLMVAQFHPRFLEALSFSCGGRLRLFVAAPFWNELSSGEQECLLLWLSYSAQRANLFSRMLWPNTVRTVDRDTQLTRPGMPQLLEKAEAFRRLHPPSAFGEALSGLGILGPSLLAAWPRRSERILRL